MKNILLSIIIANYNNDKYLSECLGSILSQTFKELEVVVFDDCSIDNSCRILKQYENMFPNKVRVIYSPENIGVSRARHEAILYSRGEYITTLDSDDFYFDNKKLQKEMELILKYKSNNKNIISFSRTAIVDKTGDFINYQFNQLPIKEGTILENLIARNGFIPRDFIFKKEIYFKIGGFDFCFNTHEDWDLKIRLAKEYKYYYTGIKGTAYRIHGDGLSSISHAIRTKNLWAVFNKNINLIRHEDVKRLTKKEFTNFMQNREKYYLVTIKS